MKLEECIEEERLIFFDANVLIACLRDENCEEAKLLEKVPRYLRVIALSTLFEVAYARYGRAARSLRENQLRIFELGFERVGLQTGAEPFDRFFSHSPERMRGRTDLGDALLAATAIGRGRGSVAIATENGDDFACFGQLDLVDEFL